MFSPSYSFAQCRSCILISFAHTPLSLAIASWLLGEASKRDKTFYSPPQSASSGPFDRVALCPLNERKTNHSHNEHPQKYYTLGYGGKTMENEKIKKFITEIQVVNS